MIRAATTARRALTALVAILTLSTLLLGVAREQQAPPPAPDLETAADLGQFQPGNIIADTIFFDPSSMDVAGIQAFLDYKGRSCVAGEAPCLKDYRVTTTTRTGDRLCNGYVAAPNETAATIISKVAWSCRVNPRVLLVLLQKEMGLVTATRPTLKKYERATGYACPDSANGGCDPTYAGLMNQLYRAAWQYQKYAATPSNYGFRAGQTSNVLYHPNTACGRTPVYIANQATAGLYIYTPYVPNSAALNAGYGTGNSCSSYGNRNFWLYYTDWFGSTQAPGGSAVADRYNSMGGPSGTLGDPIGGVICGLRDGGCAQGYEGGAIYWSPRSGAHVTTGPIRDKWGSVDWENGGFGYPTTEVICGLRDGGCVQSFQTGAIYWSPNSGARLVYGAVQEKYGSLVYENGPLGYPLTDTACGLKDGGCWQSFQGGSIYSSTPSGAHTVTGPIASAWAAQRWEQGTLGYPTTDTVCGLKDTGCGQSFQGGSIYSSPVGGTRALSGSILAAWQNAGFELGRLGYPTSDEVCGLKDGGCGQVFQGGTVYRSPASGTASVSGAIAGAWASLQHENGVLGYPVNEPECGLAGGCGQVFQGGTMLTSPTGTFYVSGAIQEAWTAQRRENGALGFPTANPVCGLTGGGCQQTFQGGTLWSSPGTGARQVSGTLASAWSTLGAQDGTLGYPVLEQVCGLRNSGCGQLFQGGTLYSSPAGTAYVAGAIRDAWGARGWENGPLGYPTANPVCGLTGGGCQQTFQGGTLWSSPGTGARQVSGTLASAWSTLGAQDGTLGYPVLEQVCGLRNSGCGQLFQGGTLYSSPAGTAYVAGAIRDAWGARGWENGPLGYPTANPVTSGGTTTQTFQRGILSWNSTTGVVTQTG
ncbi:hypothetical protein DQ237_07145 [Blastococcus sp. TF02-8]|uniref:hypothetical protein n=1 Tax=Blastococcus sp. TF02-8 TaxID=2250574 RepID=UPI000DEA2383|nr:hypothetical protein [Blastococcus sp. TF02-8]RBY96427.1 hypothetical protein DQ237_07145 [Blastococcus sp. TF02-8]